MTFDLKHRFGSLLAAHRKRRGMTQHQLAEASGLSKDMIGRLESGATGARFPTIEKLAEALQVDPAELFTSGLPKSALSNPKLNAITVRLAKASDADLDWLDGMLEGLLARKR